jgi:TPR repeat protein
MTARISISVLLLLAAGATAAQPRGGDGEPNPIQVPGANWHFDAFVVTIPDGEDWASFSKSARSAELGKKFADGRTAAVVVESTRYEQSLLREEDLLRVVRRQQATPADPASMRLTTYTQEAITPKGVLCARTQARFEDRRPQYPVPGALVVAGLSCARPDRPEVLVSLRFAERFDGAEASPALTEPAQRFLASLRFLPPPGAAITEARNAVGNKRSDEAVALLRPAADEGDTQAALFLGNLYLYGTGIESDPAAARRYLEIAAQSGHPDALYNLGAIYDKAIGVVRDVPAAMQWFARAADQRDPQAQLNLAIFHLRGDGVPKDAKLAEQWLRRAAGNGSARARGMLATLQRAGEQ